MSPILPRQQMNEYTLHPEEIPDLADYIYDRIIATPFEHQHTLNIKSFIQDWFFEGKSNRLVRRNGYTKDPVKRTPEYHSQLVGTARGMGLIK